MPKLLPRFARPSVLFWLQPPVKFRKILRALSRFTRKSDIYGLFWLQPPVKFGPKFREFCSLRSAMWFIFASTSSQFRNKIREHCLALLGHLVYFGFSLRQIRSKINFESSVNFARPCSLFWLQPPVNFGAKFRELCLTLLGHLVYFGFSLPSNSE